MVSASDAQAVAPAKSGKAKAAFVLAAKTNTLKTRADYQLPFRVVLGQDDWQNTKFQTGSSMHRMTWVLQRRNSRAFASARCVFGQSAIQVLVHFADSSRVVQVVTSKQCRAEVVRLHGITNISPKKLAHAATSRPNCSRRTIRATDSRLGIR